MTTVHAGGKAAPIAPEKITETFASLTALPRHGKTAAYIHVPFCESHCLYCGFYRKKYDKAQSRAYADALVAELRATADCPLQNSSPIHAVYLGGGTPTSLEAPDLKRILTTVRECLPLANDCEITVEGRIHNFGPDKMESCLAGGANRFSIGVQTFDTALRQSMKRLADRKTVLLALARLKEYDQAAVIIDLIYGFPNQTMEMWQEDIRIFQSLELDGVDLYQLKTFEGTPLHAAIERGKLPKGGDQSQRAQMYAAGVEMMDAAHYRRLSVNHWGRTTRERNIYNHMMKSPAHCLPFGPGAGGTVQNHFLFLESDYDTWRDAVMQKKQKPIAMMQKGKPHATLEKTITSEMELCRINLHQL
ncbi:MAG: heme anaerobic degradation radical SAM methyltransferase ChuW/HutW, partial [Desulfobacterales bacterium]|nr:heme anaerobic degradation radical SAM methyltransferase ChuW/HutW [Desulfobacterales bacterium]